MGLRPFIPTCHKLIPLLACSLIAPLLGQSLPPAQSMEDSINRLLEPPLPVAPESDVPVTASPPFILHGRLPFQLGLTVGGYYDDNIYIQSDAAHPVSDFIWSVAPLAAWNSAGQTGTVNSVQLVYAATTVLYQDHTHLDTVDQAADIIYGYSDGRTDLVVSEEYNVFQETNPDVGHLVRETSSTTSAQLNYQLTGKTSLDVTARQSYVEDRPGFHSTEWTVAPYIEYQVAPKTTVGLGGVLGKVDLDGPNQTYEQTNTRVSYNPDAKLSFSATAGLEFRETEDHSGADLTPNFSLGLAYEPFDGTELGANAYRRYEYSLHFYGQDYLSTGVSAFVSQRFFHRFYFVLSGSFEDAQYRDNFSAASSGDSYDYATLRPGFSYSPVTGFNLHLFYQYRVNLAEGAIGDFTDQQVGFSADYTY